MKKGQLIKAVAERCGQPQAVVREVLDDAAEIVRKAVAKGDEVFLFGLGKLSVSSRGQRKARNLHTGEAVMVPPRRVVLFRPSDSVVVAANAQD